MSNKENTTGAGSRGFSLFKKSLSEIGIKGIKGTPDSSNPQEESSNYAEAYPLLMSGVNKARDQVAKIFQMKSSDPHVKEALETLNIFLSKAKNNAPSSLPANHVNEINDSLEINNGPR